MLQSLKVSNYAIIENLEISFSRGFNIITGETGAGKSILIGALGLIMGNRADTKVLFDLEKKCVVEAHFDIKAYHLSSFFEANDLEFDENLIIRREILPNSKSRAFINDSPATLKMLRELCSQLIDMHQQFDTLGLNNPEVQLAMIDAYAKNGDMLEKYTEIFELYNLKKTELNRLIKQKAQAEKDQELLMYHLDEFEKLSLEEGQLSAWEEEMKLLENAETIKSVLSKAAFTINEADPSIISGLEEINYDVSKITSFHSSIEQLGEKYFNLIEELRELASEFENQAEKTDLDPERLGIVQEKLDLAYQLQAKHHLNSEEEMFAKWEEISDKVNGFKKSGSEIKKAEEALGKLHSELDEVAAKLSAKRKKIGPELCKQAEDNLHNLSMENAKFQIEVIDLKDFTETGKNEIKFLFSANLGGRLQEISEVASGGELSRLSLCIKSELAKRVKLPTLIFDEIDSGVSGAISMKMGQMIKKLSGSHQIINITHSPQIASKADRHYRIFKESNQERSYTKMEILEGDEKTTEIAKMLSGDPPSEAAMENARVLMAG
ncbi:DNA repair protein RecN [Portibacter lacus]|uniref:DNA repair protein RecN n=1 Tax=Portibacter lacus TaxID=1099794 RepID=A0AA37SSG3_9BACT|nr:DNA repair protein RecN [Portibacter lacus]GLR19382.1 DNA repair protein RecN [Portibacter lacus]